MSSISTIPDLQLVTEVGKETTVTQPTFSNGLVARANSTTIPGAIIDQTNVGGSSAGSLSIRLLNTEFINYKFNSGVSFAGAVMSWPVGVVFNGMANSALTGGYVTSSALANFIFGTSLTVLQTGAVSIQGNASGNKFLGIDTSGATASTTTTLNAVQTVNRAQNLQDVADTFVYRASTDTLTNKDVTSTTNTFPTKTRRFVLDFWTASFRNGAGGKFWGEGTTSGYQPPENIHLTKVTFGGNVTVNLAATNAVLTIYKGAQSAGNECFQVTQSLASTGQFRVTDTTVNNSGMDAITTSDTLSADLTIGAGTTTINNPYIVLEGTYDSA